MRRTFLRITQGLLCLTAVALLGAAASNGPRALTITEKDVGPINVDTRVDVATIEKLFPGYAVRAGEDYQEDIKVADTVEVSWKGRNVLVVHSMDVGSTQIHHVEVLSPEVAGPRGLSVGSSFAKVFQIGTPKCERGIEQLDAFVFCYLPKEPNFTYVGDVNTLTAADGYDGKERIPPLAALKKLKMHSIDWLPLTKVPPAKPKG